MYPLQMTDIPDEPFDKITINLITDLNVFTSVNQHIFTIISHLTGWSEAFPIPNKKADTMFHIFIKNYLPVHMWPRYILSNNGRDFKNQLMDDILQQLDINQIFFYPYHPEGNGKQDHYLNQVLASYHMTPHLTTGETPFFLVYERDPNFPLHQLLETMQCFLVTQILDVSTRKCISWL